MPPCRHTSVAPRSHASRTRPAMSSRVSRYGLPRRFRRQRALGEPAEPALEGAHVRVVDVAVADVGDVVADGRRRSSSATAATAATSGPRAANRVTISSSPTSWPGPHPGEHLGHGAAGPGGRPRDQRRGRRRRRRSTTPWSGARPGSPRRRAHVGGVLAAARGTPRPGRRGPGPRRRSGPCTGKRRPLVEPAVGVARVLGVDRQPGGQREAAGLGHRPQAVEGRPGPLGVHVVGGDGRDAAPVVDAGVEQRRRSRRTRLGGACRWTSGGRISRARAMASR